MKKNKIKTHEVYTDGACTKNPGGHGSYAAIFIENNKDYHVILNAIHETSSPRMEIMPVLAALNYISKNEERLQHKYNFFSDSEYVVKTINGWMHQWAKIGWDKCGKRNIDLWHQIHCLWDKKNFTMQWVRGHSGNLWNEFADEFCTQIIAEAKKGEFPWYEDVYYKKPFVFNEEEHEQRKLPKPKPRKKKSIEEIQAYIRAQSYQREQKN